MSRSEIESAIRFIPAEDRALWVEIGMAVKSALGDAGFCLWDEWGKSAASYKPDSSKSVWRSIRESGRVTVATLFHHAKQNGWRGGDDFPRLSPEEAAELQRAARMRAEAEDKRRGIEQARAAERAADLIKSCSIGLHPYLAAKGFPDERLLVAADGALVIPMRCCLSGALTGAQVISVVDNEWKKKMLPGMRAKGAALRIGSPRASEAWLVEGYATGLSVMAALRLLRLSAAVVVCFSDHNLTHVAGLTRGARFVFADNDASGAGERAAISAGLQYAMSDTVGHDANDLHQSSGLMAVAKKIMEARRK